jgi:hypothetical protein
MDLRVKRQNWKGKEQGQEIRRVRNDTMLDLTDQEWRTRKPMGNEREQTRTCLRV